MVLNITVAWNAKTFIKEKNGDNITFKKDDVTNLIGSIFLLIGLICLVNKVWVKFLKQLSDITDYH